MLAPDLERRRLNGAEQVRDGHGRWRTVSVWNPAAGEGRGARVATTFGRQLGHRRVRYIVEVPVTAHFKRADGSVDTYTKQPDGKRWTIPVDDSAIGDVQMPQDIRAVRDVGDHQRQKAFIREAIVKYLMKEPRDENGDIVLQNFEQSDAWFTLSEGELGTMEHFTFSTETEFFVDTKTPFVETVLDRPLRHFAHLPAEMLFKLD